MSAGEVARRLRLPGGFVTAGAYLIFARPSPGSLALGASVAFAGVLVRGWAAGHIRKGERLAVSGPYAHTRNPLYFGSFLIACGFAIAAHPILVLPAGLLFLLVYSPTIAHERAYVASLFPQDYAEYERNVPLFVPRSTPWRPPGGADPFSADLYMRHGEWKALLGFVAAVTWLGLRLRYGF